jgi:hypothetical protein
VEGRHGLQTVQRLWDVDAEISDLQRWNFRYDGRGLGIARESHLVV